MCPPKLCTAEATLLYGRGMRAGIDRREQKKRAAEFEADMLRKSREAFGLATDTIQVCLVVEAAQACFALCTVQLCRGYLLRALFS